MKKILYFVSLLLLAGIVVVACKKDDDSTLPGANHTVTGFTPASGSIGTLVTVSGTNFTNQNISVNFNGVDATVSSVNVSGKSLMVLVPEDAETGKIAVTIDGVEVKSTANFTVTNEITGPESIELAEEYLEMYTLDVAEFPEITNWNEFPDGSSIQIESNNPDIVDINEDGDLLALQAGVADITITIGELTATVDVDVNPSIIVAGYESPTILKDEPYVWVNNTPIQLSQENGEAYDARIHGRNIVVAGVDTSGEDPVAVLWSIDPKHNISTTPLADMQNGNSRGYAIDTEGTSIYVAGYQGDKAILWEVEGDNIKEIELSDDGSAEEAEARAMVISEGKVLVVGYTYDNDDTYNAMQWEVQNGIVTNSTDLSESSAFAEDISLGQSNSAVIAGAILSDSDYEVAVLWDNENPIDLTGIEDAYSNANSVDVDSSGGLVAVGSAQTPIIRATLWRIKNQEVTSIHLDDGPNISYARSVYHYNGVDYIVGIVSNEAADYQGYLWEVNANNEISSQTITSIGTDSELYSVFVK